MILTKERNTSARLGDIITLPVAAGVKIYAGALVAINTSGYAVPAANTANFRAAGRAEETIDNTGGAAGAVSINVRRGAIKYANDATIPVAQADLLGSCYIRDDQTVRGFDNGAGAPNPVAGKVLEIEPDGVWVEVR